jgi:hypothetical protein
VRDSPAGVARPLAADGLSTFDKYPPTSVALVSSADAPNQTCVLAVSNSLIASIA